MFAIKIIILFITIFICNPKFNQLYIIIYLNEFEYFLLNIFILFNLQNYILGNLSNLLLFKLDSIFNEKTYYKNLKYIDNSSYFLISFSIFIFLIFFLIF